MPLFDYQCRSCSHHFEALVLGAATPSCPACNSEELEKQLSGFAIRGGALDSSDAPVPDVEAGCRRCGDPRGPGSCSN